MRHWSSQQDCGSAHRHRFTRPKTMRAGAEPAAAVGSAADTSGRAERKPPSIAAPRRQRAKSRKSDRQAQAKKPCRRDAPRRRRRTRSDVKPPCRHAVANANAQWPSETAATNTYNIVIARPAACWTDGRPARTDRETPRRSSASNAQVVAADQLNELDRAISDEKPADARRPGHGTIDAPVVVSVRTARPGTRPP